MRFARIGPPGAERPAVGGTDGRWHDLRPVTADVTADFVAGAPNLTVADLPVIEHVGRFGPPLAAVGKVVCIGLNYRDHARESRMPEPAEPVMFLKAADTVVGADDDVLIPRGSSKTDWEVELAVVIGATARYLESPAASRACIAGYAISNDVSEREFQHERGGQWDKGKNCETFNPFGPWIVTPDEAGDPQRHELRLWVNGELRQNGRTADMIFDVDHLVWYLSQFTVLHPGDVINTGTPAGVAAGLPGTPFLRAGDVLELEISRLGRQRQTVKDAP